MNKLLIVPMVLLAGCPSVVMLGGAQEGSEASTGSPASGGMGGAGAGSTGQAGGALSVSVASSVSSSAGGGQSGLGGMGEATASSAASSSSGMTSDAGDDVYCMEPGVSVCGNVCTNLMVDVYNCGKCGHECASIPIPPVYCCIDSLCAFCP